MNVYLEQLGVMCALFYENRLGIKKSVISFVYESPCILSFKSRDSPPCYSSFILF